MTWKPEDLAKRGYDLIAEEKFDAALEVGERLKVLGYGMGHEIRALAHSGKEDNDAAIRELEAGTAAFPDAWLLWELLGNCYSDEGRFDESHTAYGKALGCPGADMGFVRFNMAVALEREGMLDDAPERERMLEDALEELALVPYDHEDLASAVIGVRMRVLNQLEEYAEALDAAQGAGTDFQDWPEKDMSCFLVQKGIALWRLERDAAGAIELAMAALDLEDDRSGSLWLIREVEGRRSPDCQYFRILVEGTWTPDEAGRRMGFIRSVDVVAETLEEALEYIRRFEPPGVRDTLRVENSEALEKRPEDPKGVYRLAGRALFPPET